MSFYLHISIETGVSNSIINPVTLNDHEEDPCPPRKRPATQVDDVADAAGSQMSSSDKYWILNTQLNPDVDYIFPKNNSGYSFQHQWLRQFPWLVYSRKEDGGYCLPCVLFSIGGYHSSEPGILLTRPLKNLKKALDTLRKHSSKEHHQNSIV